MRVSPRFVSLFFFVATVAISAWAVSKYRDLQRSVSQQRETIARQSRHMERNALSLRDSNSLLREMQRLNSARQTELEENIRALQRSRTRLAELEARNREGEVTAALQRTAIARNAVLLRSSQARSAAMQSAGSAMEGATYGMTALGQNIQSLCGQSRDDPTLFFCRSHFDYLELMNLATTALRARVSASNAGNYEDMRSRYVAILQYLDRNAGRPVEFTPESAWRAVGLEGIAYADLKLDRLSAARSTIDDAVRLAPQLGIVGVTSLKIACTQGLPAAVIRVEYAALLRRLDERITRFLPDDRVRPYAQRERFGASRDEELYFICAYANLPRAATPTFQPSR